MKLLINDQERPHQSIEFATPRAVYQLPKEGSPERVLGAHDFWVHVTSEEALGDLDRQQASVTIEGKDQKLTNRVWFRQWEEDGKHHAFGVLVPGQPVPTWS